ncbi:MAG: STN domain-containing protein, partial [Longimicrobiales bacterium]
MRLNRRAAGWEHRALVLAGLVLLVAPGKAAGQTPLDRTAGLEVVDEPLETALRRLQQATGISLVYSPDLLPRNTRVSCSCSRSTVAQALRELLEGTGLDFVWRGGLVTIVPAGPTATPQPFGALAGQVIDADGGSPVPNAMV